MQATTVTRVLVWSRWLRLCHWTIAIACIGLIVTGWLMSADPLLAIEARDYHYIFSALLLPALLFRIYLLFFGKGTELIDDCEPNRHRLNQALQVIRYYLTLGKIPLPKWYSHNPLWGPVYLLLLFFLILVSLSGLLLLQEINFMMNLSILDLHLVSSYFINLFVLLHIPAVFAHDLSGAGSDISGMINGHRIFQVEDQQTSGPSQAQQVSLEALLKKLK